VDDEGATEVAAAGEVAADADAGVTAAELVEAAVAERVMRLLSTEFGRDITGAADGILARGAAETEAATAVVEAAAAVKEEMDCAPGSREGRCAAASELAVMAAAVGGRAADAE
jgi:hypothetical protein